MNVCVIEDEKNILKLIEYDLKHTGFNVDTYSSGLDAKNSMSTSKYDVYIIDWMLPGVHGIDIVKHIRLTNNQATIIMLTIKSEESDILDAFDAGVDDYITKPFSPRELVARIKAQTKRLVQSDDNRLVFEDIIIETDSRRVSIADETHHFTKKEFDLLVYFVLNKNIVLSRDDILNKIWDFEYDGDTRIVDVHVFKLRNKFKKSICSIDSVRGVGYVLQAK